MTLTACTGRGGGQLPPQVGAFNASASFGFSFSCEDKGGTNPQTGKLAIELSYTERSTAVLTTPFGIHGTVDTIDPVLESAICAGQNPPPGGNELIFLGQYRTTSAAPLFFPKACTTSTSTCRFEVIVRDNDNNLKPSPGDFFQISLAGAGAVGSKLEGPIFYTRAGLLSSGNLTVS
ncbi:MAG TPA: hypothetical protein VI357_03790 [Mycobacteriales bacterium]